MKSTNPVESLASFRSIEEAAQLVSNGSSLHYESGISRARVFTRNCRNQAIDAGERTQLSQIVHNSVLSDTPTFPSTVVINMRPENGPSKEITHMENKMNLQTIVASKGVKKLGPKEGRTKLVAGVRLTWKATGEDTGYATSFYEMDLPPGKGIPLRSHPYAEVFYVVSGYTDYLRVDDAGKEEWVRCGPGDTVVAPINALHAFHNRTDAPSRFISSSVYYHEVFFETYAPTANSDDPLPPEQQPTEAVGQQCLQLLKDAMKVHMYAPQADAASGLDVLRGLEDRNRETPVGR